MGWARQASAVGPVGSLRREVGDESQSGWAKGSGSRGSGMGD